MISMPRILLISPVIGLVLAGCNTVPTPIIAVAADDVGVVGSFKPATQGGASLTLGYKGAKFAIMPVENQRGELLAMDTPTGDQTYSIFTQLGVDAKAGVTGAVAVQQVLAVGPAADKWAAKARTFPLSSNGQ
ncbi:MAG TPA: hypothetical protein VN838_18175 [Bradyrhizobium sp.]|nr:hypothetical protein [Bradyrhizobium sp.]